MTIKPLAEQLLLRGKCDYVFDSYHILLAKKPKRIQRKGSGTVIDIAHISKDVPLLVQLDSFWGSLRNKLNLQVTRTCLLPRSTRVYQLQCARVQIGSRLVEFGRAGASDDKNFAVVFFKDDDLWSEVTTAWLTGDKCWWPHNSRKLIVTC
ncbi:hypothetical protein NQ317_008472 [Molorchus minor]|uniref:Uncharacterized protein n=1 Tax=Molorchus minor TaxID=1323400 RepID=A0ABQ9JEQ3_9CUCU|nr:hypothetical protein NQ317_008472 [Molorchus minor]